MYREISVIRDVNITHDLSMRSSERRKINCDQKHEGGIKEMRAEINMRNSASEVTL